MIEGDEVHSVVGYDAKERYLPNDTIWTTETAKEFLLRQDVVKLLSTDGLIWPSIFDTAEAPGFTAPERSKRGLNGLPLPEWIGPNRPLWDDFENLKEYASKVDLASRPFWLIAITLDSDNDTEPFSAPLIQVTRPVSWRLLGFDVSDSGLLSGLSNCGYDASEISVARLKWESSLNHFHLFDDLAAARRFRDFTDTRVPEHAPFYVFGLWKIGESRRASR